MYSLTLIYILMAERYDARAHMVVDGQVREQPSRLGIKALLSIPSQYMVLGIYYWARDSTLVVRLILGVRDSHRTSNTMPKPFY